MNKMFLSKLFSVKKLANLVKKRLKKSREIIEESNGSEGYCDTVVMSDPVLTSITGLSEDNRCIGCSYYSTNGLLRCAVNPTLAENIGAYSINNCVDFKRREFKPFFTTVK